MNEITISEPVAAIWLQMEGESDLWYRRFIAYYVPLGPSRNLTRAYMKFLKVEDPEKAKKYAQTKGFLQSASIWSEMSRRYQWRERAEAFDLYNMSESMSYVDQARETLLKNADAAAKALVDSLTSPRLAVAAAKEILDRAGLPGTHIIGVGKIEPYSADDLKRAETEAAEFERSLRDGTVIDVKPVPDA